MNKDLQKKILFITLFSVIGILAMQVPFSQLMGAQDIRFSLFDFYGPIAGAFVGSLWGVITVAIMQLGNWAWHGFSMDAGVLIRMLPMFFAVLYFTKQSKYTLLAPVIAMIAFWAHPEGRGAWYFALYWTIPLIAYIFHKKYLFARALGSTFTAHSVGGALWIWTFNMKSAVWISLIPIVWKERILMAIGITITYIAFNYLLSALDKKFHLQLSFLKLNPKYSVK